MLEYININGYYNNISLKDISFHVQEGDFFVIFGPDDSGKTELIELFLGICVPSNGKILYRGEELSLFSSQKRKNIRFVPDDILLMDSKITAQKYLEQIMKAYKIAKDVYRLTGYEPQFTGSGPCMILIVDESLEKDLSVYCRNNNIKFYIVEIL